MSNLTPQELALYLGQEAETSEYKGFLSSVSTDGFAALDLGLMGPEWRFCAIEDVKLLLRPFADITEEEAKEIAKLADWQTEHMYYAKGVNDSFRFKWKFPDEEQPNGYAHCVEAIFYNQLSPKMFQYLLSKGFDLFGFIESGKAIDRTTLTANK